MTAVPRDVPTSATALQLLTTAERLFAENGLAGVSLRQIAAAAGSANSSAVHYHFGTKDRLIEAIFAYRLPQLLERRALLKTRLDPDDLHGHLEAHLLPVLELAESPGNAYVSFVEQLQRSPESRRVFATQPDIYRSVQDFLADIRQLLPDIPTPLLTLRATQAQSLSINAAAGRERAISNHDSVIPFGLFVATLTDGLTGFLAAPVSPETARLLTRTPDDVLDPTLPTPTGSVDR
ncbi:TetR/AcrR family transcriptional regulator [Frankia sp. AgB1.9]|uniref:TetR/AcrR family transcriptional regulator n=1 Tax=unclassified Frankia TaxID=2632575 RepID=UPI001933AFF4|nr:MULTISPECIES: TetR/AcrR family transcriptional regulator [unclassified Frankia]MBL7489404.1 TetR/AcrR family transcriptional regulator [Frankia sp. AgW1.1]MBL7548659.1 TetR/AcrR family transcriptional regulator [Frankia sp. AgB1.9]MBL7622460.1 TetR/AcrR family transcriptional regulator [Frankia sp. AgB1.8]